MKDVVAAAVADVRALLDNGCTAVIVENMGDVPGGMAAPWTVRSELCGRSATSAALIAPATAIGVAPERFAGNSGMDVRTNQAMITCVANSMNPNNALGFVSSEVADLSRGTVRTLAYQHYDQVCGFCRTPR